MNSAVGSTVVKVNGKQYPIDSNGIKIKTNYPRFDTLFFLVDDPHFDRPVLCNFKPDTTYSVSGACCGSLDIVPASKLRNDSLEHWDIENDFDKIQNQLLDMPFISIRTLKKPKDSIYAWHADAACMTEHKTIDTKPWQLGVPPKCFYWSNITTIQFFKTDPAMAAHEPTALEDFLSIDNIVELAHLSFRLFDNQRFVIVYDERKNLPVLKYE